MHKHLAFLHKVGHVPLALATIRFFPKTALRLVILPYTTEPWCVPPQEEHSDKSQEKNTVKSGEQGSREPMVQLWKVL